MMTKKSMLRKTKLFLHAISSVLFSEVPDINAIEFIKSIDLSLRPLRSLQ